MGKTTKIILAVLILAVLLLISSLVISFNTGNSIDNNQIEIGGVFHLSGPGAFWGVGEYNGALLAIEDINSRGGVNGNEIKMIVEDCATDFPKTANAIQKLVNVDGVDLIIGPTWFGQLASPLAEQFKVLFISPSAGTVPQPNKYFFDVWPVEIQEIIPTVNHMKENGIEEISLIYSLNDWSQSMRDNFVEEAEKQGISIIKEFPTNPDEGDFRTIITQIKSLDIDAVYAPFAFYPSQGAFSKQMKESNLDIILYSSSGTENPVLLEAFPEIEGTIYSYPAQGQGEEAFTNIYIERFGEFPSPSAAYSYDATNLLINALKQGNNTPEEVSEYLSSLKGYQGVTNTILFDENGRLTEKEHIMKEIRNGEFVAL